MPNAQPQLAAWPLDKILVGQRHRQDLGDIVTLAHSIQAVGLLQPLVLDAQGNLVAGLRRLQAVRKLGWKTVPVYVAENLNDALPRLRAEHDENVCRKAFTKVEAAQIGAKLEELERADAKQRQRQGAAKGGKQSAVTRGRLQRGAGPERDAAADPAVMEPERREGSANSAEASSGDPHLTSVAAGAGDAAADATPSDESALAAEQPKPKPTTRGRVAASLGMSGATYAKLQAVLEAAKEDPDHFGDLKEQIARTDKVDPAYRELKQRRAAQESPKAAPEGAESDSTPAEPASAPASPPTDTADADGGLYSNRLGSALSKVAGELSWITPLPDGGLDAMLAQRDKWDWSQVRGSTLPQLQELIRNLQEVRQKIETAAAAACGGGMGATA